MSILSRIKGALLALPMTGAGVRDRFINFIASKAAPQFQRDLKERIAQVVTARDPQSVNEVLQALQEQAARDENFARLLQQAGIGVAGLYGRNLQAERPEQNEP